MWAMPWLERTYADLSRPLQAFTFVVDAVEAGRRLDALLSAHYPWRSRTHYQGMIARGEVRVDDRPAKPATRPRRGQTVVVRLPVDPAAPSRESADGLRFLYEDEHLAAVDKPSGMTVHPAGRTRHGTLINKLHARYRSDDPARDVVPRLGHRIDRDTSGVVLVVKNRPVDALVTDAFTERRVEKTYLAIVSGVPRERQGSIDAPLGPDPEGGTQLAMKVRPDGQAARTRWHVERAFSRHALLRLEPRTGRTHQIRVHLAHLGHPIVCDHLYGDLRPLLLSDADPRVDVRDDRVILERLALHAHRIELDHPVTGARLVIESPLPADLAAAVDALAGMAGARS